MNETTLLERLEAVKPSHWTTILVALTVVVLAVRTIYIVSKSRG